MKAACLLSALLLAACSPPVDPEGENRGVEMVRVAARLDSVFIVGDCDPGAEGPGDFRYTFGVDIDEAGQPAQWREGPRMDGTGTWETGRTYAVDKEHAEEVQKEALSGPPEGRRHFRLSVRLQEYDGEAADLDTLVSAVVPIDVGRRGSLGILTRLPGSGGQDGCGALIKYSTRF